MIRSVFNYLRYGYTRQKAVACLDEFLASMVSLQEYEPSKDHDMSLLVRNYAKSLACIYPDLTVRYGAKIAAALPDATSLVMYDCLSMVLDHADRGDRMDPAGVRDAMAIAGPFVAAFQALQDRYDGTIYRFKQANPRYWSGPMSATARTALDLNSAFTR